MCVILQAPKGVTPKDDMLEAAYANNADGFGIFFPTKGGKVHAHKILPKTFDDVLKVWKQYKDERVPKGIHFRLKTKGSIEKANSHPFRVLSKSQHGREVWLMHNGTITNAPAKVEDRSDTWHFVNYLLRPILAANPELVEDENFHKMMSDMVGRDRLLLLDGQTGTFTKINPTCAGGHEKDNIWISNSYGLRDKTATKNTPVHNTYSYNRPYGYDYAWNEGYTSTYSQPVSSRHKVFEFEWKDSKEKLFFEQELVSLSRYAYGTPYMKMRLRIMVKNIGNVKIKKLGIRCNLKRIFDNRFQEIALERIEAYGPIRPTAFNPNADYINDKDKTNMKPNEIGTIILEAKATDFKGTLPEFNRLGDPSLYSIGPVIGDKLNINSRTVKTLNLADVVKERQGGSKGSEVVPFVPKENKEKPAEKPAASSVFEATDLDYLTMAQLATLCEATDEQLLEFVKSFPEMSAELLRDYMDVSVIN